nr:integrase, catalytic region, zinc finger, CCHC-type, peptidase aspartic, catalytic [Tanacetum cinerariifolium]
MIENVNQKTYAYADVRAQNQDLLMIVTGVKNKLRMIEKGKNVNTKFDTSKTLGKLLCVTPFNKNLANKAKNVTNTKVHSDRSKPVTSQCTPTIAKKQQHNANVIARGMYKISQEDTKTPDSKANTNVSNSIGVIQLVLWNVDSGCLKHMTGNLQLLRNFVEKFMGIVRFGNGHFAVITCYGDYVQGNLTICHVYYIEDLGHNLFLVRQFCDGDLEVAFRSNIYYVQNLEGDDLLTGSRDLNLYTISIFEMAASSPVCLMANATSTKSWLWHRRLSHLNFGTINQLTSYDLVDGLPKFKYNKDHLCSACDQGKSKKASLPPKLVPSTKSKLELLHMDLCGPMRAKAIATACFTQNRSIVHTRHNKTPYELIRSRKPNIQYFHVFGSLCYPTNDRDDLGSMKPKADIGIFVGYSESLCGFRIYNRRTKKIMETIHVKFDELTAMASEYNNLEPRMNCANFNDSSEDSQSVLVGLL